MGHGVVKHGHADRAKKAEGYSPEYVAWMAMRNRCRNNAYYAHVVVDPRWDSFPTFLEDMGPKPAPNYSLERVDSRGPYAPENCRWIPRGDQNRNTRRSRFIECRGERKLLVDWARLSGRAASTICQRLKHGWTPEAAIFGDRR